MSKFKAVFFDLDGTLWDSAACAGKAMDVVVERLEPVLPDEEASDIALRFNAALLGQVVEAGLAHRVEVRRRRRFERLLEGCGIHDDGLASELEATFNRALRMTMLSFVREGVPELLRRLRTMGLKVGIITNGIPLLRRQAIEALGLAELVDHCVIGGAEGYNKPDARLFERAMELAGTAASETLYVGDSLITDVVGASRAGMPVAWLRAEGDEPAEDLPRPDYMIEDLREVLEIVGARADG